MSVDEKREMVLELIYEEMSHQSNFAYDKTLAEMVKVLENARIAETEAVLKEREIELKDAVAKKELEIKEKEFELEDAMADVSNANREIENNLKRHELIVNACLTIGQAVLWGTIFVCELRATRRFEETGTETSAAGRWLKNSFPKVRLF